MGQGVKNNRQWNDETTITSLNQSDKIIAHVTFKIYNTNNVYYYKTKQIWGIW